MDFATGNVNSPTDRPGNRFGFAGHPRGVLIAKRRRYLHPAPGDPAAALPSLYLRDVITEIEAVIATTTLPSSRPERSPEGA